MKQNIARKLNLSKKTITRLNTTDANLLNGGSVYSGSSGTSVIVVYTNGCGSDFTRPRTSVMTGPSAH